MPENPSERLPKENLEPFLCIIGHGTCTAVAHEECNGSLNCPPLKRLCLEAAIGR